MFCCGFVRAGWLREFCQVPSLSPSAMGARAKIYQKMYLTSTHSPVAAFVPFFRSLLGDPHLPQTSLGKITPLSSSPISLRAFTTKLLEQFSHQSSSPRLPSTQVMSSSSSLESCSHTHPRSQNPFDVPIAKSSGLFHLHTTNFCVESFKKTFF